MRSHRKLPLPRCRFGSLQAGASYVPGQEVYFFGYRDPQQQGLACDRIQEQVSGSEDGPRLDHEDHKLCQSKCRYLERSSSCWRRPCNTRIHVQCCVLRPWSRALGCSSQQDKLQGSRLRLEAKARTIVPVDGFCYCWTPGWDHHVWKWAEVQDVRLHQDKLFDLSFLRHPLVLMEEAENLRVVN